MEKQVIDKGYLTYSLTDGEHFIYGLYKRLHYDWTSQGNLYWSEVFVEGNAFALVRRGEEVTGRPASELDNMLKHSIVNLDWQKDLVRRIR